MFLYLLGISLFSSCLDCCLEWAFCILVVCGSFLLWRFYPVGGVRLVKVSWLGKLVSVFWCVEMDFFSLECNGVPSNEFCDGSVLGVTLGSLYVDT